MCDEMYSDGAGMRISFPHTTPTIIMSQSRPTDGKYRRNNLFDGISMFDLFPSFRQFPESTAQFHFNCDIHLNFKSMLARCYTLYLSPTECDNTSNLSQTDSETFSDTKLFQYQI